MLKSPEPDWFYTGPHGSAMRRINPEGVVWRIRVTGAGKYEVRWYAAPDGQRLIELARCTFELGERRVVVKRDNVVFVRPDCSELEVAYEGQLLAADQETERVAVLDSTDSIVILSTTPPVTLDDDHHLNQFLVGEAYQEALKNLQAARPPGTSGQQPD